jgi:hypothetical protein
MSVEKFLISQFSSLLEDASVRLVEKLINTGTIRVVASDATSYFDAIAFLPNNGQRISWQDIPNICLHPPAGLSGSQALRSIDYAQQQKDLLNSLGNYFKLNNALGFLFDDHHGDCVLQMSLGDFSKLDLEFFYTPGHKYLLGSSGDWLLNITMEGGLYFSNRLAKLRSSPEKP